MRILITILSMACLSCLATLPADAATRLTEQQVRNVCGKGLQSGGGNIGCTKACGTSNLCDYNCKDGKCTGTVFLQVQVETWPQVQMDLKSMASDSDSDGGPAAPDSAPPAPEAPPIL